MRRHYVRWSIVLMASLLFGAAFAAPLFLADQEVDTAEEETMSIVLQHCEGLAQQSRDAEVVTRFGDLRTPGSDAESPQDVDPASLGRDTQQMFGSMPLSLEPEAVVSADGVGAEPAGEGAGQGIVQEQGSGDESQGNGGDLDLDAISLQACKEAGLIF